MPVALGSLNSPPAPLLLTPRDTQNTKTASRHGDATSGAAALAGDAPSRRASFPFSFSKTFYYGNSKNSQKDLE